MRSASLPATTSTMCAASSGFFAASSSASRSEACAFAADFEHRAAVVQADLLGPGRQRGVRLGAADEDHVVLPQQLSFTSKSL